MSACVEFVYPLMKCSNEPPSITSILYGVAYSDVIFLMFFLVSLSISDWYTFLKKKSLKSDVCLMVASLTDTLSQLPCISLTTFSFSSKVMPSPSLAANPLDRERSCGALPSNGSREPNQSINVFRSHKSCRCLVSPNSTRISGNVMLSR